MSRVEIHAAGRTVIVRHADLDQAEATARRLWDLAATAPEPSPAPVEPATHLGFVLERAEMERYGDDCPATVRT